jgi:TonB family protein
MSTDSTYAIKLPPRPDYGAVELKKFINKATIRGFYITIALFALLILLFFAFKQITAEKAKPKLAPVIKIKLANLEQMNEEVTAPPPEQIVNTGPASRAGTPIPVPDAMLKPDMKDFASTKDIARASSEGGNGMDNGGFAQNIDWNSDQKVNVQAREEEPSPDEFTFVEVDPKVDLAEIQKKAVYPEMAKRAGIEGKVTVRVLIGKDGKPKKCIIESSDSQMLDESAKKAVMASTYTPARQNGQPVQVWISIPVTYRLR